MRLLILGVTLAIEVFINPRLKAQETQGFFLDRFQPKSIIMPLGGNGPKVKFTSPVTVSINYTDTVARVSKYLFGNNSNVYMGQMVTDPGLIRSIKTLSPNIIRYPGGNLSNTFFWNAVKGQHPADVPDSILYGDTQKAGSEYWYGGNAKGLSLSVDNYYKMLKMTHSTGLICVNAGYARYGTGPTPVQTAAHLAAEWVRYDRGRTQYWEVGNENFGPWQAGYRIDPRLNKDGQPEIITGELYGNHFKIFADSMRAAARSVGASIHIGAVLVEEAKPHGMPVEANWNQGFFKAAGNAADYFIIHSYYTPYEENSAADVILTSAKAETVRMMDYLKDMCREYNVAMKPVALTEWNIFAVRSKQSCSFISGMHAALVLGELIKNKYGMACRWDLANGWANGDDHGLFSKGDEPGIPLWNPRPVYYYMYYFQKFIGDRMIKSVCDDNSKIETFASKFISGQVAIILVNKGKENQCVKLDIKNYKVPKRYCWYSLTGGSDNGEFSQKVFINGVGPELPAGGPSNFQRIKAYTSSANGEIVIDVPARSVQYILVEN